MSLLTFTFYQYYWFYRNYRLISARTGEKMLPVARALFAIFFCHDLFRRVRDHDRDQPSGRLQAGPLATAWVVIVIAANLFDRLTARMGDTPGLMLTSLGLTFAAPFFLLPVQQAVNEINQREAPQHDRNARLTAWNWLAMILGGALLALALVGTLP